MPELEASFNKNLTTSLSKTAEKFSADEDYLWQQAEEELETLGQDIRVWNLKKLERAILWRVLILLAQKQLGEDANKLGYGNIQAVVEMISSEKYQRTSLDLGAGISVFFEESAKLSFLRTSDIKKVQNS